MQIVLKVMDNDQEKDITLLLSHTADSSWVPIIQQHYIVFHSYEFNQTNWLLKTNLIRIIKKRIYDSACFSFLVNEHSYYLKDGSMCQLIDQVREGEKHLSSHISFIIHTGGRLCVAYGFMLCLFIKLNGRDSRAWFYQVQHLCWSWKNTAIHN